MALIAFIFVAVDPNDPPRWLKAIVNWDWDLAGPYGYASSWVKHHVTAYGVWGYAFIGFLIVLAGFSNELTRGTMTLVTSSMIRQFISVIQLATFVAAWMVVKRSWSVISSSFLKLLKGMKG